MAISVSTCASPAAVIASKRSFAGKNTVAFGCARTRMSAQSSSANSSSAKSYTQQDPYSTLGLASSASAEEIKKARRRLALKFHPDVCKSDSCTAKFIQVEEAYETIMDCLQGKQDVQLQYENVQEGMMGVYDDSWEDWEEWMGWEGAGTLDYTSHINHSL